MKYFCNPLNVPYHYQFTKHMFDEGIDINREAADPSLIAFQNKYYLTAQRMWKTALMREWKEPLISGIPISLQMMTAEYIFTGDVPAKHQSGV